jgi:hypothetical protein
MKSSNVLPAAWLVLTAVQWIKSVEDWRMSVKFEPLQLFHIGLHVPCTIADADGLDPKCYVRRAMNNEGSKFRIIPISAASPV